MRPSFVSGIAALLCSAATAAAPPLAPCTAAPPRLAVLPAPPGLAGLSSAMTPVCRAISGHEHRGVCLTGREVGQRATEYRLSYWVAGNLRGEWPVQPDRRKGGTGFTLELAHLDGHGDPALIVAAGGEIHILTHDAQRIGPVAALGWGDESRALRVGGSRHCVLRLTQRDAAGASQVRWFQLSSNRLKPIPPPT